MKIGIDCRYAEDNLTGIGSYLTNLSKRLARVNNEVYLFYSHAPKNRIDEKNISTAILETNNKYLFEQILIPRFLLKEKIDVYHAAGNIGVSKLVPCPSVVTVHDIIPILLPDYFNKSRTPTLSMISYKVRLRSSLSFSKKIISISNFTKESLVGKMKVNPEKIKVIGQGVDVNKDKVKKTAFPYINYIICNSGISERKNLNRLICSFKNVLYKFPDYKLLITGENHALREELVRLTEILGIEESVVFTGFLDKQKLYSLIKGARVVCNVSEIEGFGIPLLEAFSLGVPVVCSNIPSFREVAGSSATFVNPYDIQDITKGINELICDNKKRNGFIEQGYFRLKKYSWEDVIEKILIIYKEVLQ